MKTTDIDLASRSIARLLTGMSLDSFRVYSTVLFLGYYRADSNDALPGEVWISCSGDVLLSNSQNKGVSTVENDTDFFVRRASILGQIYHLIGATITEAGIDSSGALTVTMQGGEIKFVGAHESFEEVWAVMSDSSDVSAAHRWYIALEDSGMIGATIPDA